MQCMHKAKLDHFWSETSNQPQWTKIVNALCVELAHGESRRMQEVPEASIP